MRNFKGSILIAFLMLCWNPQPGPAGGWNAAQETLSAQTIVDRAVARAEAQHTFGVDTGFESHVVMSIQSLDEGGKVSRTDTS